MEGINAGNTKALTYVRDMAICPSSAWSGFFGSNYRAVGGVGQSISDEEWVTAYLFSLLVRQVIGVALLNHIRHNFRVYLLVKNNRIPICLEPIH